MVAGSAQLGLCKTENLPKGRDSATATKSSSKEIGKQFKMATKIFGTFMDRLDSLKVNMIMEGGVIRIDVRSQVEESYQDLGWGEINERAGFTSPMVEPLRPNPNQRVSVCEDNQRDNPLPSGVMK